MKLVKLLANLGYGSRREVEKLLRAGMVTTSAGTVLGPKDSPSFDEILFSDEALDRQSPLNIIMNKPTGFTCSTTDLGDTVYDLLPHRFSKRNPSINPVGRLDKDTSGMLLLTDDGKFLHRVIHPKSNCLKVYDVVLDRPLSGEEGTVFGSGELVLESDAKPLLPAGFEKIDERRAKIILHEGRYHQVRRMFAAVGNHVVSLRRISIGGLSLPDDLKEGEWRFLEASEVESLFAGP